MTDRAAHVGYHLVGEGRRDLEADIGYRPRAAKRLKRLVAWRAGRLLPRIGRLSSRRC